MSASFPFVVRLTVELTPAEAADLALWLKRCHFDNWLEKTDAGQTRDQRTEQAYRFRDASCKVEEALADARGTRPR